VKRLVIFDLDGTLAKSKAPLTAPMGALLGRLMDLVRVAVISGGAWTQFQKQLLPHLPKDERLRNLSLLPTSGTRFMRYDAGWKQLYAEDFTAGEKKKITAALGAAFDQSGFQPSKHWGELIEDRGSQITLSALGQEAPLDEKKGWDPDFAKRQKIKAILDPMLPDFSVTLGGSTSIDITRPGVDKAYGLRKLKAELEIPFSQMLFVGDALFPGGNDHPARSTGAECIEVRDPLETERVVRAFIAAASP
jgi:HAD superfamily hydrolase (TIGR01484 family)